ncbi:hypothetical protein [Streptomyces sp. NPDC058145]|uniref:hypothetical protein n=1 Tax=Streptomyces sp. NPDC058145 TaxID=3346356 RepID=UPI0036EBFDBC
MTVQSEPEPEPGREEHPVPRDPPDQQAGPGADSLDAAPERPPGEERTEPDEGTVTRTDEGIGTDEQPQPDEPSA